MSPAGEGGLIIEPVFAAEYTASDEELARLGLFAGEMVYRISRLRRQDGQLRAEDVRLPCALFPGLLHKDIFADISTLAETYGLRLGEATERISLDIAPPEIAKALIVPKDTKVLTLVRVVHLKDGRPAQWRTSYSLDRELGEVGRLA
jgi:DNA-binding GntR family transcriptional regulator